MRNLTRSFRRELPNAKTLSQKVAAILRKYGTDAHVYLPGIGVINGLTAGNYLDSAGTTLATVDNPVGKVDDAAGAIDATQATTANKPILRRGAVNLLTYSEQFDNAAWGGSNRTITANSILAPNNTQTADTITRNLTTTSAAECRFTTTQAVSTTYTLSVYAKVGTTGNLLYLRNIAVDGTLTTGLVKFNLTTGVVDLTLGATYTGKTSITSIGNGWYRCSITGTTASTITNNLVDIGCTSSSTIGGTNGDFLYAWGAQLQTGSVATDYIPTTSAPASSNTGNYWWKFDSTDLLTATYPAGYESATVINALAAGQQTLTAQNIVGSYSIGPSVDTYGRFIFRTGLTASELTTMQTFANRLAGV